MEPRTAIIADGRAHSYDELDTASMCVAGKLLGDNANLNQTRVAFLVAPGFAYAAIQRGIWRAGGVAVPLAVSHPPAELEYVVLDTDASIVVADASLRDVGKALARTARARFVLAEDALSAEPYEGLPGGRRAPSPPTRRSARRSRRSSAHGAGRLRIVCCSSCRCTTFTASSTASAVRWPFARPARCCIRSTGHACGSGWRLET